MQICLSVRSIDECDTTHVNWCKLLSREVTLEARLITVGVTSLSTILELVQECITALLKVGQIRAQT